MDDVLLPSIPEQAVGCYCCLVEQERSPDQPDAEGNGYVICFMGGSEKGLNLYPFSEGADAHRPHLYLICPSLNCQFQFQSLDLSSFLLHLTYVSIGA